MRTFAPVFGSALIGISSLFQQTIALAHASGTATSEDLVVDVGYAKYRGFTNTTVNVNAWYNVHYAQAPVGDLRWRAPEPIEPNCTYDAQQVIDASKEGPLCVQGFPAWTAGLFIPTLPERPDGDEDCLLVNVYAPTSPVTDKLPVIVLLHGGGYTIGSAENFGGAPIFRYEAFPIVSHSQGGVIAVSVQYRLGAFGFLDSDDVRADGTANAGFLDQRLALEWVQKHIGAFGGDPEQVTIYGGSAGGGSVTAQMMLHGGAEKPPFKAAIAEYPWWQTFHSDPVLSAQYQQLLHATNCTDLSCLRQLDADPLIRGSQQAYVDGYGAGTYGYGDLYFGPTIDGTIMPSLPSDAFAAGAFTKGIPLLTDRDGYEGVLFTNQSTTSQEQVAATFRTLWPTANQSFFTDLFATYPSTSFNSSFFQSAAIIGDAFITCPTRAIAQAVTAHGSDVYKMIFRAGQELHGATGPFIFDDDVTNGNATIARWLQDYIVAFARGHDPNGVGGDAPGKPAWPPYAQDGTVLVVNETTNAADGDAHWDATPRCAFWQRWGDVLHI